MFARVFAAVLAILAFEDRSAYACSYPFVYFAYGKTEVISMGRSTIGQAIGQERGIPAHCLRLAAISAYTDYAEAAVLDPELDLRRANAVRDVVVELGWPGDRIVVVRRAATQPLVQTPAGTEEPQNRQVLLVFGSRAEGVREYSGFSSCGAACVIRLPSGDTCPC